MSANNILNKLRKEANQIWEDLKEYIQISEIFALEVFMGPEYLYTRRKNILLHGGKNDTILKTLEEHGYKEWQVLEGEEGRNSFIIAKAARFDLEWEGAVLDREYVELYNTWGKLFPGVTVHDALFDMRPSYWEWEDNSSLQYSVSVPELTWAQREILGLFRDSSNAPYPTSGKEFENLVSKMGYSGWEKMERAQPEYVLTKKYREPSTLPELSFAALLR